MTEQETYEQKSADEIEAELAKRIEDEFGIETDRDRPMGPDAMDGFVESIASQLEVQMVSARAALGYPMESGMTDAEDFIEAANPDEDRFEPEDDDGLSEYVESLDSDESIGLAAGLPPRMAKELDSLIEDTGSRATTSILNEGDNDYAAPGVSVETPENETFDTFELEIDHDKANTLLKGIYQRIHQRHEEGYNVDTLVLGMPQYRVLEPWAQGEKHVSIEQVLPVNEVILVSGPMVHVPIDNKTAFSNYLAEQMEHTDG